MKKNNNFDMKIKETFSFSKIGKLGDIPFKDRGIPGLFNTGQKWEYPKYESVFSKGQTKSNYSIDKNFFKLNPEKRVKQQGKIHNMWGNGWKDTDKDGVIDILDCDPFNRKKQGSKVVDTPSLMTDYESNNIHNLKTYGNASKVELAERWLQKRGISSSNIPGNIRKEVSAVAKEYAQAKERKAQEIARNRLSNKEKMALYKSIKIDPSLEGTPRGNYVRNQLYFEALKQIEGRGGVFTQRADPLLFTPQVDPNKMKVISEPNRDVIGIGVSGGFSQMLSIGNEKKDLRNKI